MSKGCGCLDSFDEKLAEQGLKMDVTLSLGGDPTKPTMTAHHLVKKRGDRPVYILPAFCPFCGSAYDTPKPKVSVIVP